MEIRLFEISTGISLPFSYQAAIQKWNALEGLVDCERVILWPFRELLALNVAYEVEKYAAGLLFFGSNGGGEAYAFDTRNTRNEVLRVPFVGMHHDLLQSMQIDMARFQPSDNIGSIGEEAQKEIFEIHPVVLGGDPVDPKNKTLLTRADHIQAVRFWNAQIQDLRRGL